MSNTWAKDFPACICCRTRKFKHHSKGLCTACYARVWRKGNPEKVARQADTNYKRNYVLRNDAVNKRRRERYRENKQHRANALANAQRQYQKNPQAYKDRSAERRKRVDRDTFEKIKPRILQRDGYVCRRCGAKGHAGGKGFSEGRQLTVHHLNLDGADHRPENLTTLCEPCHKTLPEHHAHKRKYSRRASSGLG